VGEQEDCRLGVLYGCVVIFLDDSAAKVDKCNGLINEKNVSPDEALEQRCLDGFSDVQ